MSSLAPRRRLRRRARGRPPSGSPRPSILRTGSGWVHGWDVFRVPSMMAGADRQERVLAPQTSAQSGTVTCVHRWQGPGWRGRLWALGGVKWGNVELTQRCCHPLRVDDELGRREWGGFHRDIVSRPHLPHLLIRAVVLGFGVGVEHPHPAMVRMSTQLHRCSLLTFGSQVCAL